MKLLKKVSISNIFAILLGIVSISIILGAYYLINKTKDHSFEQNMATLSHLQQLDAKWSVAILKTKNYTLQDFDAISAYILKIKENFDLLDEAGLSDVKKVGKDTVKAFQIYKNSVGSKKEAVEHYKSEQAILRNSVRYLPTITKELQNASDDLNSKITSSSLAINQLLLTGGAKKGIKENLQALKKLSAKTTEQDIKAKIENYITHAKIILEYKTKVLVMLNRAMAKDFDNLSQNVINAYAASQEKSNQQIKYLQMAMVLASLVLLAIMFWFLTHFIKVNQQVVEVRKDVVDFERRSAAGDLALGAFHQLKLLMPKFYQHVGFIKKLKIDLTLLEQRKELTSFDMDIDRKKELTALSGDVDTIYGTISELEHLIDDERNSKQDVKFDFNHVILKAIETVNRETKGRIAFSQQLKDVSIVKGSPLDLFQITVKLFRQVAKTESTDKAFISVKTWASKNYANMLINLPIQTDTYFQKESLVIIHKLVEANEGKFKFMTENNGEKSAITLSLSLVNPRLQ